MRKLKKNFLNNETNFIDNDEYRESVIHIDKLEPKYISIGLYIEDEKSLNRLIRKIESIVRTSYEYKQYRNYLKENLMMNHCSFFNNLNEDEISKISIELHHTPFTLYDLTFIMFNHYVINKNKFRILVSDIADKVMELHYMNLVGIVPLSITAHELVHAGKIFIPLDHIYGKHELFFNKYRNSMNDQLIEKYISYKNDFDLNKYNNINKNILKKKYTYLKIDGVEYPSFIKKRNKDNVEEISSIA